MKLKYIYFYTLPLIIGVILFAAFSSSKAPDPAQGNKGIIKFSHKVHKDVTDCESCHTAVPTSKSLNDRLLPNHNDCSTCHDVSDEKNCNKCHYDNINEPLIQPKTGLIFNHASHLKDQKLKCETCHKGVDEVAYAEDASQPNPVMENCYSCHNGNTVAPNACESCHISTANLKPQSHKSSSFLSTHKFAARSFNANCVMCHDNASCQECHSGEQMITAQNSGKVIYQPYSPSNLGGGVKQQKITRVHSLDYRFTHGMDAKGKTSECTSCHQVETFCATCHQSKGGDFSLGGIEPTSHLKPTFMAIGVGSGGGDHARLARRDIESCASCHDVQGTDPVCITCHLDSDGIKGTNPRTHPANFMRDVHGDWHSDQGSVCYNCHTSQNPSSPPGVGFCGYCHSSNVH